MTKHSKYTHIKPILRELISDVIQISSSRWRIEWGYQKSVDNQGIKEYAIEIARDYARRSISAMLNLYYYMRLSPSDSLTKDLHKMHLDKKLRTKIQVDARCYSFIDRDNQKAT